MDFSNFASYNQLNKCRKRNFKEETTMRIYKTKNYDEMSRKAANIISAQIILKPESVLGLATGSSPIGTYKQLIEWYN